MDQAKAGRLALRTPLWAKAAAILVLLLLATGLASAVLIPASGGTIGVPAGLTLWVVLAWRLDRREATARRDG